MQTLYEHLKKVDEHLSMVVSLLNGILHDLKQDGALTGNYKDQLVAWLDLVCQYATTLEGEDASQAAITAVDAFLKNLQSYYSESSNYQMLLMVG
jgi:hypothetical protein